MTLPEALGFVLCALTVPLAFASFRELEEHPEWRSGAAALLLALGLNTQLTAHPWQAWPTWTLATAISALPWRRTRAALLALIAVGGSFLISPGIAQTASQRFFTPQRVPIVLIAGGLLIAVVGGSGVVELTLGRIKGLPRSSEEAEATTRNGESSKGRGGAPAGGMVIGVLERTFTYTGVLLGHPEVIALIVAVKSVARFPEFTSLTGRRFAEYFLIGTLLSLLIALGAAYLVRAAIGNVSR